MRSLLEAAAVERRPYQAPVSYRIIPRVLGQLRRAQAAVEKAAETSLRAVADNPIYAPPDPGRPLGELFSSGGFHNAHAIQAIDGVAFSWAELCQLAHHLAVRLTDDPYALGGRPRGPWGTQGTGRETWVYAAAQTEWAYE